MAGARVMFAIVGGLMAVGAGATLVFLPAAGDGDAATGTTRPGDDGPSTVIRAAHAHAQAARQPIAIFHAFDQAFTDVTGFVCTLASQGYSHVQISPAQKSNSAREWWGRYQPIDYSAIEGRGSEAELQALVTTAHGCGVKVIADVVFNHMAKLPQFAALNFPGLSAQDFHPACRPHTDLSDGINYNDGNRNTEIECWLGGLPDLDQGRGAVKSAHRRHLDKLLALGIDGFRFDAAKHMATSALQEYINYVNEESGGSTWNYLEVIDDSDTKASDYNSVAAVTDFTLYRSMKRAFTATGDLRSLRVPEASVDPRSVTFGRNHDTIREINSNAIDPYNDPTDSYLATAYTLAREGGTPLVLNWDNADSAFIPFGVKFRSTLLEREGSGSNIRETVLAVVDSPTLLILQRGAEGWFVVNKATSVFDVAALDLTLTDLEGCYRELRNDFSVAIERRADGKKWLTRWGSTARGGLQVQGRDALYFIREAWERCQPS